MSAFATRAYDAHLFLAAPDAPGIWDWGQWQRLVPLLNPLMESPRGRTSVRMTQLSPESSLSPHRSGIRFGPLGWNAASHEKWTHRSPRTEGKSDAWEFVCASVWAPGPGICENQDCPPDAYLTLRNELVSGLSRDACRFSYALMLARACDAPQTGLAEALELCRELTRAVLSVQTRTTWSPPGHPSMTDWEVYGGPFKVGSPHRKPLSPALLEGDWNELSPAPAQGAGPIRNP